LRFRVGNCGKLNCAYPENIGIKPFSKFKNAMISLGRLQRADPGFVSVPLGYSVLAIKAAPSNAFD
jgi:hypothetical protein